MLELMLEGDKIYKLGEIASFRYGTLPKKELISEVGNYPIFTGYRYSGMYPMSNCEKNDIIVVARGVGGTGDVKLSPSKNWLTNLSIVIKADPSIINNKYFYYKYLKSNLRYLDSGSAQSQITIENLKRIEITLPPLPRQSRIASILSSLDDKIELNLRMNKTLEAIAQAIFKEWFVDFRFPGFDGEMVDGLPKGWDKSKFMNHLDVVRGLSYKGSGLTLHGEGVPMNNLNSIYEGGGYKFEGIKYYKGEYKERHVTRPGDIIVTNTEQGHRYLLIGYPAVVPHYFGETTIFSHHIYRVQPTKNSYLTSQFIYYSIMQPAIRDEIVGCCNGTTVNMLKIDGLQRPNIILPPKDLVMKFSEFVQSIWLRKETNYVENQTLTQLRDTILPKLMTGKIKVA
jgi:type I restriction enzyme, S subunit